MSSVSHSQSRASTADASIDEEALCELYRRAPSAALEQVIEKYGGRIERLCRRLLDDHADSSDIAQDVFVIAIEKASSFRGDASLGTWLTSIAIRLCRRWTRRQMMKGRVMFWLQPNDRTSSAVSEIDTKDAIERGLAAIPARDREVLVLRYIDQLETAEVAEILDIRINTLEQRLSRARRRLAQWIEQDHAQ